jgi:hypothetical protein
MEDLTFVKEVLGVLNTNTQIISELRIILAGLKEGQCDKTLQAELKLKMEATGRDIAELKVIISTMGSTSSEIFRKLDDLETDTQLLVIQSTEILKISKDLNIWSKVKLPFVIATITIILWAIGMFVGISQVDEKVLEIHNKAKIDNTTK